MSAPAGTAHRYRAAAIRADYLRAGAGLAMTAGPLAAFPAGALGSVAPPVLGGLALLFAGFGARTWLRQRSRIRVDETGIAREGPLSSALAWDALTGLALRHYAPRRGPGDGWMQLTVKAGRQTLRIESTIEGFTGIAAAALRAAEARDVPLSPGTIDNLRALGVLRRAPGG